MLGHPTSHQPVLSVQGKGRDPRSARWFAIAFVFMVLWGAHAADLSQLKVLYVGDSSSPRATEFKALLELNVAQAVVANRNGFDPKRAAGFDVVLLDWPQSGETEEISRRISPLGPRDLWIKPTVLLGSAGLNLAIAWKAKGGSG